MPQIDLVDESFIAASPQAIADVLQDSHRLQSWWPDLKLSVFMDRELKGVRWSVTGSYVGSTEIWIEEFGDGAIVHYYLRVDPSARNSESIPSPLPDTVAGERAAVAIRAERAKSWKKIVWALKDELEAGRNPGEAARA